ncbi:MAG: hypothetical protein RR840_01025 [Clostridium sp.]
MADVNILETTNDNGFISVYNGSGYIAIYTVQYELDGAHHFYQTPRFSLFFTEKVNIPAGATKINLRVWYYLDIRTWVPFFDMDFETPPSICYKLYGTIYNPGCGEIPCDAIGAAPPENTGNISTPQTPVTPPMTPPNQCGCCNSEYEHNYYECVDNGEEYNCQKRPNPHCCRRPKCCCRAREYKK